MRHLGDAFGKAITDRNEIVAQIKVERRVAGLSPNVFGVVCFGMSDAYIKQQFAEPRLLLVGGHSHAAQLNCYG